jgi:cysteinyl-tRNA synthetase
MHGAPLNVGDEEKMSKSEGNILTLSSQTFDKKIDPLAFRYLCFMTHYRKPMTYKFEALEQASTALENIRRAISSLGQELGQADQSLIEVFKEAVNDDLNMPQAIAVLQKLLKSDLSDSVKRATLENFDTVLGLNLIPQELPEEIKELVSARDGARAMKDWNTSDKLRSEIEEQGYIVEDGPEGKTKVLKK